LPDGHSNRDDPHEHREPLLPPRLADHLHLLRRLANERLLRQRFERIVLRLELRVFRFERIVAREQRVAVVPKAHRLILARWAALSGQPRSGRCALITPDIVTTLSASRRAGGRLDALCYSGVSPRHA